MTDTSLAIGPFVVSPWGRALVILGFVLGTTALSGPIVRFFIDPLETDGGPSLGEGTASKPRRFRASVVIGKCENILVLALVFVGEITGLAIIFAAKSLVRREDIQQDAGYFLGGTLVNTVWAFFMGVTLRAVVVGI